MTVKANKTVLYNVYGKRFGSLTAAEVYLHSLGTYFSRLRVSETVYLSQSSIVKYIYRVPIEPYIDSQRDVFLLCGDILSLIATVTGVPDNQLIFEWSQLSGVSGIFSNPDLKETLFFRPDDDTSDKQLAFKETNLETGVFNFIHINMWGTPTEFTYLSGGIDTRNRLIDSVDNYPVISTADRPRIGDAQSYVNERIGFFFNKPKQPLFKRADLLLSLEGMFVTVDDSEFDDENSSNFIPIPPQYFGLPFLSKVRFIYNYRIPQDQTIETPVYEASNLKYLIVNDKVHIFAYNNQGIYNLSTDEFRAAGPLTQEEVDQASLGIFPGEYSFNNNSSDIVRETHRVIAPPDGGTGTGGGDHGSEIDEEGNVVIQDIARMGVFAGDIKFSFTTQRETSGQIGGGG